MLINQGLFTSESVSDGHPDKICDQISDTILDACLKVDKFSRVAIEAACKGNTIYLLGEITSQANLNYHNIVKNVLEKIGHVNNEWGIDSENFVLVSKIAEQSQEIAVGVDSGIEIGAGDQGMMFGFACNETEEYMPMPIMLAHALMLRHKEFRNTKEGKKIGPDAKAQVSVFYDKNIPLYVDSIVLSTQHSHELSLTQLKEIIIEEIVKKVIPPHLLTNAKIYINPAGLFTIGGPIADAGLTGRKIIVDTYGGYSRHGGGAFSGKDPTKVDRSAAYAARQIARYFVAKKIAKSCEVRVAYAIGIAQPVMINIDTFGTGAITESDVLNKLPIGNIYDLMHPQVIIERLNLRAPIYAETSTYGHFGRVQFPWEKDL